MEITTNRPWWIEDLPTEINTGTGIAFLSNVYVKLTVLTTLFLFLFLFGGSLLQLIDPAAGILDVGMLTVLLLGGLGGLAAILCSLWLQELLWQPFKIFRRQFHSHFNQLTSWQQCILYFSVFFLLLYAALTALAILV